MVSRIKRKPKTIFQKIALVTAFLVSPIYLFAPLIPLVAYGNSVTIVTSLGLLAYPPVAFSFYRFPKLFWLWVMIIGVVFGGYFADNLQRRYQTKTYCDDMLKRCTRVGLNSWECPDPTDENPNRIFRVAGGPECGPFEIRQMGESLLIKHDNERAAVRLHNDEFNLGGYLFLPDNKVANRDITFRLYVETGNRGKGYSERWTIRKGQRKVRFEINIARNQDNDHRLMYSCEAGCFGIVDAYYSQHGPVYSSQQSELFKNDISVGDIAFGIMMGAGVSGSIRFADGNAPSDMNLMIFVDDLERNIGIAHDIQLQIAKGEDSVEFQLGLPMEPSGRWKIGYTCNDRQEICRDYKKRYYSSNGVVGSSDRGDVLQGGLDYYNVDMVVSHNVNQ